MILGAPTKENDSFSGTTPIRAPNYMEIATRTEHESTKENLPAGPMHAHPAPPPRDSTCPPGPTPRRRPVPPTGEQGRRRCRTTSIPSPLLLHPRPPPILRTMTSRLSGESLLRPQPPRATASPELFPLISLSPLFSSSLLILEALLFGLMDAYECNLG